MPTFTGIFNTDQFTADHEQKSFASMITRLMPNGTAPLFALTSKLQDKLAVQTEHGFFTKTMVFPGFTITADALIATTTLTVVDTGNLVPGQIHRFQETGENIIINVVNSATSIDVGRSVGTVAAADVLIATDNLEAYQVGNGFEESSDRPVALSIQPVRVTNLTQIFRDTWALSGTAQATQVIAGDTNVAENRQDAAAFHAGAIEKALFFGQKSQGTRNGQPFRTMDGLHNIVSDLTYYPPSYSVANVSIAGATTNYEQLLGFLDPVFDQATDPKIANARVLFCGGTAINVINGIGRLHGQYEIVEGQTSFGLQFNSFKLPRGTFHMIEHPLFNTNADWSKMAIAVDLATFNLAYLGNRKTQNKEFNLSGVAVDDGIDAVGGTLTTEVTVEVRNPPANAVITELTAAA